jgi:hypothetical protein
MSTSTLKSIEKMNKAELVAFINTLQAENVRLTTELNAYKPDPNGRKLNNDKADAIRQAYIDGVSKNKLAQTYQVSRDSIDAVLAGTIYKANFAKYVDAIHAKKAEVVASTNKPANQTKIVASAAKTTNKTKVVASAAKQPKQAKVVVNDKAKELAIQAQKAAYERRLAKEAEIVRKAKEAKEAEIAKQAEIVVIAEAAE